jgi:hypothetical protein
MSLVMSEHQQTFVDTMPSRPAPLHAAHAASEIPDLAREVAATRRTLRALDLASAIFVGLVALAGVLLAAHLLARLL